MNTFTVGINQRIVGKCDPDRLSHPEAWAPARLTLPQLANHIGQGHPWMPARLDDGQRRYQQSANHAEVLALDIDGGMTIAQALGHPVIAAHCGLGIESASSSPELNKYRLVFVLPQPVDGWRTIRICNRYLAHLVGTADPSCKDASRYFFGAPGRVPFLLNEAATLPTSFVADAIAWHDAIEAQDQARAEQARRAWENYQRQNPGQDTDALILEALNAISPDCDYNTWLAIGMALAGMGDQWLSVWDSWSAGSSSYKPGECDRKWSSFRGKRPAPEVIFGKAKGYGWKFPRRSWLDQVGDRLTRKPSAQKSAQALKAALGDKPFQGKEYEPGQRATTWRAAIATGYRHILDLSGTGSGKSHTAGQLVPDDFGDIVKQLMYLSNTHYAPTTETLKDWPDLHGRHNGLTRETTTGGSRLRRAKRGEERVVAANCSRNGVINSLRSKNVSGADSAGVVCGTCPLKDACGHSQGKGFGFLNQRKLALSSPRLRLHPASAPGDGYEYGKVLAIWDEPSESFTIAQTVEVTADDVRQTVGHLAMTAPGTFDQLRPLLTALGALFDAKQGRYGIDHQTILAALPALPDGLDVEALKAALLPDLEFLDPEVEDGVRVSDLPGRSFKMEPSQYGRGDGARVNLRSHFSEDSEAQQQKADGIIKQWLPDLMLVLQSGAGALHLSFETLTVTRPDYRLRAIASATAANIYLDATLAVDDLALLLGCEPSEIYVCRERPQSTGGNLTITQVADLGRVTMSRGKDQERRIGALVSHYRETAPDTKVIDFKRFDGDGAWWRDSRGVNDFQSVTTLLLVGTPCRNLAALQAEYACLTGACPTIDDQGFTDWVDRVVHADIMQGIGRLRANRRAGEQLHIVLVSDFALGIPTQQVAAKDITVAAASKVERVELAIAAAVEQLQATGSKVTQAAIAQIIGASQGYVARFRKLLQTLLESSSSKSNNFLSADTHDLVWGALDICKTPKDVADTVGDLLSGLVDPVDLLLALMESPPDSTQSA